MLLNQITFSFSGASCDGYSVTGLVSGSLWVPNITSGTIQLLSCPVGYVVETGSNAQEQVCSKWASLIYVEVHASLFIQLNTFTALKQFEFKQALALIASVSTSSIMIASLNQNRRLSVPSIQITSWIETANTSSGAKIISRMRDLNFTKYLSLENLPSGFLNSLVVIDMSSGGGDKSLSTQVLIGICVGVILFSLVFLVAGYFICTTWRKDRAHKYVLAAFRSSNAGDVASLQHLPLKLRPEYIPEIILGKGAFGYVLRARRIKTDKLVAIKIISPERGVFEEREIRQLKREEHVLDLFTSMRCEHAVNFVGIGASKIKPNICWFVLEYLHGDNVESVIKSKQPGCGPLDASECIKLARSVLAALKVMHSHGMVHRDIKPSNMIRCDPKVPDSRQTARQSTTRHTTTRQSVASLYGDSYVYKLIDFGTALGIDETVAEEAMMTMNTGRQMGAGTPPYMSPEMFTEPDRASYPTDLWSLGVSAFEIVTGVLPFQAHSNLLWSAAIAGNMDEKAPSVLDMMDDAHRAVFDHNLAKAIAKALEKKISDRYQSVDEMHEAIYSCLVNSGEACYSAFISYRVASEAPLARLLFDELNHTLTPAGHRVTVYWDAHRLVKGEEWEEGFSSGLLRSLCVLPLVSYGSTAPLAKVSGSRLVQVTSNGWEERPFGRVRLKGMDSDPEDNVLKEFLISLALLERRNASDRSETEQGLLQAIYPILIGRQDPPGHPNYPKMGSFFQVQAGGGIYPEVPSPPTTKSVATFLAERACLPVDAVESASSKSVSAIMKGLTSIQGCQLWEHPADLPEAELTRGQMDLVGKGYTGPAVDIDGVHLTPDQRERCAKGGFDELQLRQLKAQVRHRLPDIHELIDRAVFTACSIDPKLKNMLTSSAPSPLQRHTQRRGTAISNSNTSTERSTNHHSAGNGAAFDRVATGPALLFTAVQKSAVATASLEISSSCDQGAAIARVLEEVQS